MRSNSRCLHSGQNGGRAGLSDGSARLKHSMDEQTVVTFVASLVVSIL